MSSDDDDFLSDYDEEETPKEDVIDVEANNVEAVNPPAPSEQSNTLLRPVTDDLEEVAEVYHQFEEVKTKLLEKEDLQKISGNVFIKKSGWRKIATAFNVSIEATRSERTVEDGVVFWKVWARAVAPNGKYASGMAMCSSNESNFMETLSKPDEATRNEPDVMKIDGKWRRLKDTRAVDEHAIYATAETRAKNRAISDLVGGGEVSAEELDKEKLFG